MQYYFNLNIRSINMTIELKRQLVDFEKLATSVQRLKGMLEELIIQLEEKMIAPLIKEGESDRVKPAELMVKTSRIMRFVNNISNVIYKLTKITVLLEKQWVPKAPLDIPSEEYLLDYIRYMHKCGKLDFTV